MADDLVPVCTLCGEPMPAGEQMFKYHGYSGPCPTPPKPPRKMLAKVSKEQWIRMAENEGDAAIGTGLADDLVVRDWKWAPEAFSAEEGARLARLAVEHNALARALLERDAQLAKATAQIDGCVARVEIAETAYKEIEAQLAAMTAERDDWERIANEDTATICAMQQDRSQLQSKLDARLSRMTKARDELQSKLTASEAARRNRQIDMAKWVADCFGPEALALAERGLRLGEEAAELAQAMGTPEDAFMRTAAAAYAKPAGDPAQEAGGVGTTLLAACAALDISADACEAMEFARIHRPEVMAKAKARNERNKLDGTSALSAETVKHAIWCHAIDPYKGYACSCGAEPGKAGES